VPRLADQLSRRVSARLFGGPDRLILTSSGTQRPHPEITQTPKGGLLDRQWGEPRAPATQAGLHDACALRAQPADTDSITFEGGTYDHDHAMCAHPREHNSWPLHACWERMQLAWCVACTGESGKQPALQGLGVLTLASQQPSGCAPAQLLRCPEAASSPSSCAGLPGGHSCVNDGSGRATHVNAPHTRPSIHGPVLGRWVQATATAWCWSCMEARAHVN